MQILFFTYLFLKEWLNHKQLYPAIDLQMNPYTLPPLHLLQQFKALYSNITHRIPTEQPPVM
jgi:hypothetical protein